MSAKATEAQRSFVRHAPNLVPQVVYGGSVLHIFYLISGKSLCGQHLWGSAVNRKGGLWTRSCAQCLKALDRRMEES